MIALDRRQFRGWMAAGMLGVLPWISATASAAELFSSALRVEAAERGARLHGASPFGERSLDVALIPVHAPGALITLESLTVRDVLRGTERRVDPKSEDQADRDLWLAATRRLSVHDLGVLRHVRVARAAVDRRRPLYAGGRTLEFAGYTARVDLPGPPAPGVAVSDSALAAGPYRELLDAAVSLPERLPTAFAAAPVLPEPTRWQPRPSRGGSWLRIPITQEGPYAVDAAWLSAAGWDPATVEPQRLVLMREGQRVPTALVGPEGAGFQGGQRLLFHGLPARGEESNRAAYYLGVDAEPLRFPGAAPATGSAEPLGTYRRTRRVEQDNGMQTQFGSFLSVRRTTWVWGPVTEQTPIEARFTLPGLDVLRTDEASTVTLRFHWQQEGGDQSALLAVAVADWATTLTLQHGQSEAAMAVPNAALQQGENLLQVRAAAAPPAGLFFDHADVEYVGRPAGEEGQLEVRAPAEETTRTVALRATGLRGARTLALELTDPARPRLLPVATERGFPAVTLEFGPATRLLLIEDTRLAPPPPAEVVDWVDWADLNQGADLVVLYHGSHHRAAQLWAKDARQGGLEVMAVPVSAVYDAFSHGEVSSAAIRHFLTRAVYGWQGRRPWGVVLLGEATSDGRNETRAGLENQIPAPLLRAAHGSGTEQFSSDAAYGWLTPGDELADILVARVSPSTPEEGEAIVRKFAAYRAAMQKPAPWSSRLVAVSDTGEFHDAMEDLLRSEDARPVTRIALQDVPWADNYYLPEKAITRTEDLKVSPAGTALLEEAFNAGAAVVTFIGHGAPNLWSNQRVWFGGGSRNSDILRLRNADRLPFVTSFTCNNAVVDYPLRPWNVCIAEDFLRQESGGAIACFMPSGPGYLASHGVMARGFLRAWKHLGVRRHVLLAEMARLYHQGIEEPDDHSRMFVFLGDPTLLLPPPPPGAVLNVAERDSGAEAQLEAVEWVASDGDWLQGNVHVVVSGPRNTRATVEVQVFDGQGSRLASSRAEARFTTAGRAVLRFPTAFKTQGFHMAIAEVLGRTAPANYNLPSSLARTPILLGPPLAAAFGIGGELLWREEPQPDSPPSVLLPVGNQADGATTVTLEVAFQQDGATFPARPVRTLVLAPRSSHSVQELLPEGLDPVRPWSIVWTLQGDRQRRLSYTTVGGPERLPDLELVPGSVRILPESPTQGDTVWIEGRVKNMGSVRSVPAPVRLYRAEDAERATELLPLAAGEPARVPALAPGEETKIRLRWDPIGAVGKAELRVVVAPTRSHPERNPSNNEATVLYTPRTKWNLVPQAIHALPGKEPGAVLLVAKVGNSGETAARRVVVNFFRSARQSEETKLGEVLLEEVPPGYLVDAVLEWKPASGAEVGEDFAPSFSIAIKGSQQRASSAVRER